MFIHSLHRLQGQLTDPDLQRDHLEHILPQSGRQGERAWMVVLQLLTLLSGSNASLVLNIAVGTPGFP